MGNLNFGHSAHERVGRKDLVLQFMLISWMEDGIFIAFRQPWLLIRCNQCSADNFPPGSIDARPPKIELCLDQISSNQVGGANAWHGVMLIVKLFTYIIIWPSRVQTTHFDQPDFRIFFG